MPSVARLAAAALGLGSALFGVIPALLPAQFARVFGIAQAEDPTVATAIRGIGVRDAVIGVGLVCAACVNDDRALRQWLLARTLSDAGDTLSVGLAVAGGARNPRFLGLGALAFSAMAYGLALQRISRSRRPA